MLHTFVFMVVLVSGFVVGLIVRGWLLTPADRRRLEALAADLLAEARIDALTRSTLAAMRAAARGSGGHGPDDARWAGR